MATDKKWQKLIILGMGEGFFEAGFLHYIQDKFFFC